MRIGLHILAFALVLVCMAACSEEPDSTPGTRSSTKAEGSAGLPQGAPLHLEVPKGWQLEVRETNGMFFYSLSLGAEGEAESLLMFYRWPAPVSPRQMPALVNEMADSFAESLRQKEELDFLEPDYDIETFQGSNVEVRAARFSSEEGGRDVAQVMFMMNLDGALWSGQFTGANDHWTTAAKALKTIERRD